MKFALTITDATAAELSTLAAFLNGGATGVITDATTTTTDDDDDNATPNASAPTVDAAGLPWDERIHSGSKATTEKGFWRRRKGISDTTVAAVEAELRSRAVNTPAAPAPMAVPPAPAMPTPPAPPAPLAAPAAPAPAPMTVPPAPPMSAAPAMPTPPAPPAPPAPLAAPAAPAPGNLDFPTFMQHMTAKMGERDANGQPLIDANYMTTVVQRVNAAFPSSPITMITDIASNPAQIGYAVQCMQLDGRW